MLTISNNDNPIHKHCIIVVTVSSSAIVMTPLAPAIQHHELMNTLRNTIPHKGINELFQNESPLHAFLRGHQTNKRIENESYHTVSTSSITTTSRVSDDDYSTSESELFHRLASVDIEQNNVLDDEGEKESFHTASTSSTSTMSRVTDDEYSISESELLDNFACLDFDFDQHDILDDEGDSIVEIATAYDTLNTSPNRPMKRIPHLDVVDLALLLSSDENGVIGDMERNDLTIDPIDQFPNQAICMNNPTTMEHRPSNYGQQYATVEIDAVDERKGLMFDHDSDLSFGQTFAKLHECMHHTSMTRELVRQFCNVGAVDMTLSSQCRGTKIPHSTKHVLLGQKKKIAKCKTARKVKTEMRSTRIKSSPLVTGVRPVDWGLI